MAVPDADFLRSLVSAPADEAPSSEDEAPLQSCDELSRRSTDQSNRSESRRAAPVDRSMPSRRTRSAAAESIEAVSGRSWSIYVKQLTGRSTPFSVRPEETVQQLKEKIFDKLGVPRDQCRLVFNNKQMDDASTLLCAGVSNEAVLFLVARLVGTSSSEPSSSNAPVPSAPPIPTADDDDNDDDENDEMWTFYAKTKTSPKVPVRVWPDDTLSDLIEAIRAALGIGDNLNIELMREESGCSKRPRRSAIRNAPETSITACELSPDELLYVVTKPNRRRGQQQPPRIGAAVVNHSPSRRMVLLLLAAWLPCWHWFKSTAPALFVATQLRQLHRWLFGAHPETPALRQIFDFVTWPLRWLADRLADPWTCCVVEPLRRLHVWCAEQARPAFDRFCVAFYHTVNHYAAQLRNELWPLVRRVADTLRERVWRPLVDWLAPHLRRLVDALRDRVVHPSRQWLRAQLRRLVDALRDRVVRPSVDWLRAQLRRLVDALRDRVVHPSADWLRAQWRRLADTLRDRVVHPSVDWLRAQWRRLVDTLLRPSAQWLRDRVDAVRPHLQAARQRVSASLTPVWRAVRARVERLVRWLAPQLSRGARRLWSVVRPALVYLLRPVTELYTRLTNWLNWARGPVAACGVRASVTPAVRVDVPHSPLIHGVFGLTDYQDYAIALEDLSAAAVVRFVTVKIDGNEIGLFALYPGQTLILERFLNSNSRFRFVANPAATVALTGGLPSEGVLEFGFRAWQPPPTAPPPELQNTIVRRRRGLATAAADADCAVAGGEDGQAEVEAEALPQQQVISGRTEHGGASFQQIGNVEYNANMISDVLETLRIQLVLRQ